MKDILLKISKLKVAYGGIHAIKGIDLEIRDGELVTLIGANGAGKTTTMKAITGLQSWAGGEVEYLGKSIKGVPSHVLLRQGLAMVPEGRGVFARMTITENLQMGAYSREDASGIADDIERMFQIFPRLKERANQLAGTMSGGEQQMLAMARILRTGARLLLLDEPTEGLAAVIIQRIGEVIAMLRSKGFTIILVEQNFRFAAKLADRHYVMEDGHVVDTFPNSALESKSDELHKFLGV